MPQNDDSTQAIQRIHNYYLDLKNQLIKLFLNKEDCYYGDHIKAMQNCLDAIYMLSNCQFFISKFYNLQDESQLVETNDNYLLGALCLYFEIRISKFKKQDLKRIQELEQANYTVQHKIGILSCNLQGLEKLAEADLITALKQEQNDGQLINIIQMLKYLYTKSPSEFSCEEDVKKEIPSIIDKKYDVLPKLIEECRNDFDKNVHTQSALKHNIVCAIL